MQRDVHLAPLGRPTRALRSRRTAARRSGDWPRICSSTALPVTGKDRQTCRVLLRRSGSAPPLRLACSCTAVCMRQRHADIMRPDFDGPRQAITVGSM